MFFKLMFIDELEDKAFQFRGVDVNDVIGHPLVNKGRAAALDCSRALDIVLCH